MGQHLIILHEEMLRVGAEFRGVRLTEAFEDEISGQYWPAFSNAQWYIPELDLTFESYHEFDFVIDFKLSGPNTNREMFTPWLEKHQVKYVLD